MQIEPPVCPPWFRFRFRRLHQVFLLLPLLAGFSSDGAAASEIVLDIPVFVGGFGIDFFWETARLYEEQRPGVRVDIYGNPRIAQKIRIRVVGGQFPDATDADLPWPTLIAAGKVLNLAPYLDGPNWEGDGRWRDTFLPGVLERWTEGKAVYGLPFGHAVMCFWYNKRHFAHHGWKPPATWEQFWALCEDIKASGIAPMSFSGVAPTAADYLLRAAYHNLAGSESYRALQLLEPGAYAGDHYRRAADVVNRLSREYFMKGWEGMSHTEAQLQFLEGRAAMLVTGSWLVNEMKRKFPDNFVLGAFNFPVFEDGVADPGIIQVGSGWYFVFMDSQNVEETVDFFRFLTSRERARAFTTQLDSPTAVRGTPFAAYSVHMQDVAAMIDRSPGSFGRPPGAAPEVAAMNQPYIDARNLLLAGRITPSQFGNRLEENAAEIRARRDRPGRVVWRHPWAGSLLLVAVAVGLIGFVISRRRAGTGKATFASGRPVRVGGLDMVIFLGLGTVLYLVFVVKPAAQALTWALTEWDGITAQRWVGWLHFKRLLFESDVFWSALGNNMFIMFVPTAVVIPLSLLFANFFYRGVWGTRVFRVCFLFPNMLGGVAATLLWLHAYNPHGGLVNGFLTALGPILQSLGQTGLAEWFTGFEGYAWLAQERLYWALVPIYIWMSVGFNLILYLAAMESVDPQLYEAAEIDGAGPRQQFFRITLPLIWEVLTISAIFMIIWGLNTFEVIWILTAQQPGSETHVLGTLLVSTLFQEYRIGQATAIAAVLFILVFAGSLAALTFMRREALE